jgi:hypothetical protein
MSQVFGKWKVVLLVYHQPTAAKKNLILVEWILSKRKHSSHLLPTYKTLQSCGEYFIDRMMIAARSRHYS